MEKRLEDSLIKLFTVATDIFGKSGRAMLDALIGGERDPEALANLALGKMRPSGKPSPQRSPDSSTPTTASSSPCCSTRSTR